MKGTAIITSGKLLCAGDDETAEYFDKLEPGVKYEIIIKKKNSKRTVTQNACMHKYFSLLADGLNALGLCANEVITVPIDFEPEIIKEYMFKPIMKALYPDLKSTTNLDTKQISIVYENLNRLTAEKFGVSVQWPSRFNFSNFDY